jgi:hypothetical protein
LKAPEDWRTPGRFARFESKRISRQRRGVRWPSTAFRRTTEEFEQQSNQATKSWIMVVSRGMAAFGRKPPSELF